jgi:hypothetical protein
MYPLVRIVYCTICIFLLEIPNIVNYGKFVIMVKKVQGLQCMPIN